MDLDSFRKGIKEEFFQSSSSFQAHIQHKALDTGTLVDSPALRALCVFMHYKLARTHRCSACKSRCILIKSRSADELKWICDKNRSQTHFKKVVTIPVVSFLRPKSWMPFVHFLVYMKNNYKMSIVEKELHAGHGTPKPCLYRWQKQYHSAIQKHVDVEKINRVGGPMHVCAVDEAHVGKLGYMVGKKLQAVASPSAGNRESRRGCLVKLSGIAVQGMVKRRSMAQARIRESTAAGCGLVLIVVSSSRRLMAKVPSALLLPS